MEQDPAAKSAKRLLRVTFALACVPVFGAGVWFIALPLLFVALILAVISMSRSGQGLGILFFTLIVAPAVIIAAPFVGSSVFGLSVASAVPFLKIPAAEKKIALREVPTGPQAEAAKLRAATKYPRLRVAGSAENTDFLKAVEIARSATPQIFDDPEWPTLIADSLFNRPAAARPAPAPQPPTRRQWSYHPGLGRYIEHDSDVSAMRSIGGG